MKQLFQSFKTGEVKLIDIPNPAIKEGHLLIQTTYSLISSGTERMLIDFEKSNYLDKAKKQPEKVKEVINKIKSDGPLETLDAVKSKLERPFLPGYCNVGKVIGIGENVFGFKIGDRVVSNGSHSEIVLVPKNLCAKVPSNVDDKEAVFTVLASIGLQGIRNANPLIGETFIVSGLGLIGIITAQLLKANGINVLAVDPDKDKCDLAKKLEINCICLQDNVDPISWCLDQTNGIGIDGVIITASTKSNDPIDFAAKVSRQRGRIILIGVTGLNIKRELFYKKELTFQVSCSYGPGRYDVNYEEKVMIIQLVLLDGLKRGILKQFWILCHQIIYLLKSLFRMYSLSRRLLMHMIYC